MKFNFVILFFIIFFVPFFGKAQTYNYTYTDPCTGNLKTVTVPINGEITVGYYGYIETFSYNEFQNGSFETWITDIFDQYDGNSPCSEIVGIGVTLDITQSTALNVVGILNSLTTIADLAGGGTTNILGGSVGSISTSSKNENSKNRNNNQNNQNGNSNINNNSSLSSGSGDPSNNQPNQIQQESTESSPNQNIGTTPESTSTSGGGSSGETSTTQENPTTSGGQTTSRSSETSNPEQTPNQESSQTTPKEGQGKTNITAGATNTTRAASREGGKPSVVASSDFVGFSFRNSETKQGLKATGGYTALRWDGQRSWGALVDYTSALKGPNVTGFYAWVKPKSIILLSGTLTVGFATNKSIYGTLSAGQMFNFKKIPKLKAVYMGTVSYGSVYRTEFLGTALIAGAMYDLKIGKRIDIKLMDLLVYAPYVSYYNDVVLKSPWVMLPSIGLNIGITKRFKFNINGGGAWDLKTSALNYTVTCGTRMLVGQ